MSDIQMDQIVAIRAAVLGQVAKKPNSLIWLGMLLLVLGIIGVGGQVLYSFISIGILGAFLLVAGSLQAVHAIKSSGWKSVSVQLCLSLLYIAAGFFTWFFPIPALEGITLWLAAIFFVTGFLRLIAAFQHRQFREWFWLILSSAVSILMGVLIMNGWPATSLWLPGLLISVELLLQGWSLLFLGFAAKSLTK